MLVLLKVGVGVGIGIGVGIVTSYLSRVLSVRASIFPPTQSLTPPCEVICLDVVTDDNLCKDSFFISCHLIVNTRTDCLNIVRSISPL